MTQALISAYELEPILGDIVLIDASMPLAARFIEGARVFDVDAIAEPNSPYPHTLPDAQTFSAHARAIGVNQDSRVIIYDSTGVSFAAARAWWMFRVFGHENVQILNGGLPAWMAAGFKTTQELPTAPTTQPELLGNFTAHFNPTLYSSYEDVAEASANGSAQIIDVRGAGRFNATARTMDGDIVPAHIPESLNLPFAAVLDPLGGAMLEPEMLKQIFDSYLPPNPTGKRIVSCASGITACVMAVAFFQTGERDVAVFDGSWIEWADREYIR